MKTVKIAFALLIISLVTVIGNSMALGNIVQDITDKVSQAEESDPKAAHIEYSEIFDRYKSKLTYISLTVNHEDLTSIEESFAEIIGAAQAEDMDTLLAVKSRLIGSLTHLKRLSGINIDSIF